MKPPSTASSAGADQPQSAHPHFYDAVAAVIEGDVSALTELLGAHPRLVQARGGNGFNATLLHYVAANGVEDELQRTPPNAVEIARRLVEEGAEVDAFSDGYGGGSRQTPLCLLVSSAHPYEACVQPHLVELLCGAGAAVDGVDRDGAPLATALAFWYPEAARALIRCGAKLDNLVFAAAAGREGLLKQFLDAGAGADGEVAYLDPFRRRMSGAALGEYALLKAALCGQTTTVQALLEAGVDVDGRPLQSRTPLHEAAWAGHTEVVRMLLTAGADASIREELHDGTALDWATHARRDDVVEMLLAAVE